MAGARIEIDLADVQAKIDDVIGALEDAKPLLQNILEFLHRIHRKRFVDQESPDGNGWAALSPRYLKRKHRNKNKILTLRGYLSGTLVGQIFDDGLAFGTNQKYGAIHQFGGDIRHPGGQRELFFKSTKADGVRNRFVKRKQSNFAQTANIGPYTIHMPKREWLGTSDADESEILERTKRYMQNSIRS